jgi:AbiU2
MRKDHSFEKQLANLNNEANVIANYVYAEMAVQHAISKSKVLLQKINMTPTFWRTCFAAFQSAAYVALGRLFDTNSPYNLQELLVSMEKSLQDFSPHALAARKRSAGFSDEARLKKYTDEAYVPTLEDIQRIRRSVERRRLFYNRAIMPVRHRYLAHRQTHETSQVNELYGKGKVKEMWQVAIYLYHLHQELWNLYHNGRKPNLRVRSRYSPKIMYQRPKHSGGPHERIVSEVRKLMTFLEQATVNAPSKPRLPRGI